MKMNKFLMLGIAGLAFAACSNEEDAINNGNPTFDGTGAVTVRLVNPSIVSTKAPVDGTETAPTIGGTIKVDLYDNQDATISQTIQIDASNVDTDTELTFWNVTAPKKLVVSMNGGQPSYAAVSLSDIQNYQLTQIPAYGETKTFTLTSETGSPTLSQDNNNNTADGGEISNAAGTGTQQGAQTGDQNKVYQLYTAKVTMAIPIARLEIGGITHKDEGNSCEYKKLTIAGVYMDKLYTVGGSYTEGAQAGSDGFMNSTFSNGTTIQDYCWKAGQTPSLGTGIDAVLKDEITGTADERSFLKPVSGNAKVWPADGKVFAYNFYPASGNDNMPKFKIYFDDSEATDATKPLPAPRYAMVTSYKDASGELTAFLPGHIYTIEKAELDDSNIIGDENGNKLYGVEVTVKEATWTVIGIDANWESK